MSERTPGLLRVCGADHGGCNCRQIWAPEADVQVALAVMAKDTEGLGVADRDEAKANAAFFVLSWNNHDDMVATLQDIARQAEDETFGIQADRLTAIANQAHAMLKAIAKAEAT